MPQQSARISASLESIDEQVEAIGDETETSEESEKVETRRLDHPRKSEEHEGQ